MGTYRKPGVNNRKSSNFFNLDEMFPFVARACENSLVASFDSHYFGNQFDASGK